MRCSWGCRNIRERFWKYGFLCGSLGLWWANCCTCILGTQDLLKKQPHHQHYQHDQKLVSKNQFTFFALPKYVISSDQNITSPVQNITSSDQNIISSETYPHQMRKTSIEALLVSPQAELKFMTLSSNVIFLLPSLKSIQCSDCESLWSIKASSGRLQRRLGWCTSRSSSLLWLLLALPFASLEEVEALRCVLVN